MLKFRERLFVFEKLFVSVVYSVRGLWTVACVAQLIIHPSLGGGVQVSWQNSQRHSCCFFHVCWEWKNKRWTCKPEAQRTQLRRIFNSFHVSKKHVSQPLSYLQVCGCLHVCPNVWWGVCEGGVGVKKKQHSILIITKPLDTKITHRCAYLYNL